MGGTAKAPAKIVEDPLPFSIRQLVILDIRRIRIAVVDFRDHVIHKGIDVHPLAYIGIGRGVA